jgi:transglutaminase-like putative cysteine protease
MKLPLMYIVSLVALGASLPMAAGQGIDLDANQPYQGVKSDPVTYQVDFSAVVTPPYKCKVLKVWMPIPPSDNIQEVSGSKLSSFPVKIEPVIGKEKLYANQFAYFEFKNPQGAQIVRHQFTIKTHEVRWHVDAAKVTSIEKWPATFDRYLRSERFIPVKDERVVKILDGVVPKRTNPADELSRVMEWVNANLEYSHKDCSLQASAVHALDKKVGHCSDYHGLCTALGRALGYPARIAYGINPYPKNSPSHCKLEVFLPPYGWVMFDVSETQQMIAKIKKDDKLDAEHKDKLVAAARARLAKGFRDNTWFLQTRGSDYDLEPPAKQKVAVVRTIYAEADGVAYAEPDPANPELSAFTWMTVHNYVPDRKVTNPFQDFKSLVIGP